MVLERDDELRALLLGIRNIAVLGIKVDPAEDAFRVPAYLQRAGYRILPVNPQLDSVLGERAVARLAEVVEPIELVDVFRAPRFVAGHADEILALATRPRAVWLQLGIRDDAAAQRLADAGIDVVQDRCILIEHRRLVASGVGAGPR